MNRGMILKLSIDITMTILMLVAMAYHITGILVHEVVGSILLVLFIAHNLLNRRWYKTMFKGTFHIRRILSITVNLLFLVAMAAVMISSIPISREVLSFIPMNHDMIFMQFHVMTSYWGFILMAIHVGMSWGTIINAMRRLTGITNPSRVRTFLLRVVAILIVVYGVQTSIERNLGSKLLVYDPFGSWNFNESSMSFLMDYLSVMGIYICGTHYVLKFVQKQRRNPV
ncbi:DUF4405 domain-containing protein [Paenibacillus arenilitoris]|uniref:DUF4405 domain-containing protein n=1 Tax=Paenibacillus arenilitoris TaxID=2772299 RepID=A0A927CRK8_9BACL|nr:DUF4405 domain-containing protein [Paenibacillus arenilitoris]MBD2872469.1 DUF4405 domain-containing protein [Paenibacillus arenilitoris]